jgi:hypothetical protein
VIIWKNHVNAPGLRCFQLAGFRIDSVFSCVVQRLTLTDQKGEEHTQWQLLLAIEV